LNKIKAKIRIAKFSRVDAIKKKMRQNLTLKIEVAILTEVQGQIIANIFQFKPI